MSGTVYFAGVDGGGTKTLLVLADGEGRELARRVGPAGLVDPRNPRASADVVSGLLREAVAEAGIDGSAVVLCAGLAGVGNAAEREQVRVALTEAGVAERVHIATDGEIALEGALEGGPGILLIAGTGSVAYGRAEDGRLDRCGGWGMMVGDEGSGYALGRAGLMAALRAVDGRGDETELLPRFLALLDLDGPNAIPPWAGRVEKAEIAALASQVVQAAEEGDAVALRIAAMEARELAQHASALMHKLAPWSKDVPVVFHGGVLGKRLFADLVRRALEGESPYFRVQPARGDAVEGALRYARRLVGAA